MPELQINLASWEPRLPAGGVALRHNAQRWGSLVPRPPRGLGTRLALKYSTRVRVYRHNDVTIIQK